VPCARWLVVDVRFRPGARVSTNSLADGVDVRRCCLLRNVGDSCRRAASGESIAAVPRGLRGASAFLPNVSRGVTPRVGRVSREPGFIAASRPNLAWRRRACRRNVPGLAGPRKVVGLWWSGASGSRAGRISGLRRRSASVVVSVARDDVAGRIHPRAGEPRIRNASLVESLALDADLREMVLHVSHVVARDEFERDVTLR